MATLTLDEAADLLVPPVPRPRPTVEPGATETVTLDQVAQYLDPEAPSVGLSTLRALPRGATETVATAFEAPALSRRRGQTQLHGATEKIRAGSAVSHQDFQGFLRGIQTSDMPLSLKSQLTNAARDVREGRISPEDVPDFAARFEGNLAEDAKASLRRFAAETFPIPPEHEKRFGVQLGRAGGSTLSFLLTRFIPVVGQATLPVFAGLVGSGEAIQRGSQAGMRGPEAAAAFQNPTPENVLLAQEAHDEKLARAGLLGVLPGLTDIVPIERLLKPFARIPGVKGALYASARRAIEQGLIEGTQEAVQSFLQNAIQRLTTQPGKKLTEGMGKDAAIGLVIGTLFGGGAGALIRPQAEPTPEISEDLGAVLGAARRADQRAKERIEPTLTVPPAPAVEPAEPTIGPAAPTQTVRPFRAGDRDVELVFPDELHARLYDYALALRGPGDKANLRGEAERLYRDFKPWVIEDFRGPGDVNDLALDYAEDLEDVARTGALHRGETRITADIVVDPDLAADYWRGRAGQGTPSVAPPVAPEPPTAPPTPELPPAAPAEATAAPSVPGAPAAPTAPTDLSSARTSEPFTARLYRGIGRERQEAVYTGPAVPIIGEARYYAPSREVAAEYGPDVREEDVRLENPLVIDNDADWRALTKAAGWPFPNPFGTPEPEMREKARAIQDLIRGRGHDGVIIRLTPYVEVRAKALQRAFGDDQIIVFGERPETGQAYTLGVDAQGNYTITLADGTRINPNTRRREDAIRRAEQEVETRGLTSESHVVEVTPGASARPLTKGQIRKLAGETKEAVLAKLQEIEDRLLLDFYQAADVQLANETRKLAPEQRAAYVEGWDEGIRTVRVGQPTGADYRKAQNDYRRIGYLDGVNFRQGARSMFEGTGKAPIGLEVRTPTGGRVRYRLKSDPDQINQLRGRMRSLAVSTYAMPDVGREMTVDQAADVLSQEAPLESVEQARQRFSDQYGFLPIPGSQHRGFRPDTVEGVPLETPIRREEILRDFAAGMGVPIYQGRIQSPKTLGFYRRGIEEVRLKRMNDIEVAAHEMAHLLDERVPEISQQWRPASNANKEVREELRSVSYDRTKLYEGFAEFVRLWMTQVEKAQAAAPKFFGWFEDFVMRSEYGPALRQAQQRMHEWFEQDAVTRARSKIGQGVDINEHLASFSGSLRQHVFDDLEGIRRMEREITGELSPLGAYETARLTRGNFAIIEGALLYGAPAVKRDGSHTFVGKGLKAILDPVADRLDDFLLYAVGRSANELMQQGREHLFTRNEIKGMLALERPEFVTAFRDYQDWNNAILDFAEAKGLINPVARSFWRRSQYLPFHRVGLRGPGKRAPGDWKGIKALTGGTDNIRDVLGNIIGNASMLIDTALTNEARLSVAKLAKKQGGARFMAQIPTEDRTVIVPDFEVERAILDALGVDRISDLGAQEAQVVKQILDNLRPFVRMVTKGNAPAGPNVVAAMVSGKPVYFEVADPLLYRALVALNRPGRHWLMNVLTAPKRIGQASVTLTADFLAANWFRDQIMGGVMSQHGFKPFIDGARGLASRVATDQTYKDFIANGGGFSSYLVDESAFRKHLERFYSQRGIDYRTVIDSPAKLLFAVEKIANAVEVATRVREFERAVEQGAHPRHAAFAGREVSTDFGMRGDNRVLGFLYDTVIFLKAGLNGMDRFYRGLFDGPNKAEVALKTALVAAASAALYALNRDNPLYESLPDWDRDNHWHVFVPTPAYFEFIETHGREPQTEAEAGPLFFHLRFPKVWEVGAIASIAERQIQGFMDSIRDNTGKPLLDAQKKAGRVILDLFNLNIVPQILSPASEVYVANRDFFLDRPIETEAEQRREKWQRAGPGTSRTIRALGESTRHLPPELQLSPKQVEHLLRGYLNTWATYGLTLSDAMFFDDIPNIRADQYPVIRRFIRQHPARGNRYVDELYDAIREATEARRTMRHLDRTYRPELADEIEHSRANLLYNQLQIDQRAMTGFRNEMLQIVAAPTVEDVQAIAQGYARSSDEGKFVAGIKPKTWGDIGSLKTELLDYWTIQRNEYAHQAVDRTE